MIHAPLQVHGLNHPLGKAGFIIGSKLFRSNQIVGVAQGVDWHIAQEVGRITRSPRQRVIESLTGGNLVRFFADGSKGGRKPELQVDRKSGVFRERLDQADEIVRRDSAIGSVGEIAVHAGSGVNDRDPIAVVLA